MRLIRLLEAILVLALLQGCASTVEQPASPWDEILTTLNQPPRKGADADGIPYTHALETDLHQLHAEELRILKSAWRSEEQRLKVQGLNRKSLRERQLSYFHERLQELNRPGLAFLDQKAAPGVLTPEKAAAIVEAAQRHPVANLESTQALERSAEIGFCFGRALLVHHQLLKAGVPQHHIAKIFSLGVLSVNGMIWRFHVAMLVRTTSGYLMLDPLQERPLPVREWLAINERYSLNVPWSQVRFHITDPRKFMPGTGLYEPAALRHPVYQQYFERLFATLAEGA